MFSLFKLGNILKKKEASSFHNSKFQKTKKKSVKFTVINFYPNQM